MIQCHCPNCKQKLNIPPSASGRLLTCPKCRGQFQIGNSQAQIEPVELDKTQKLVLILVCLFAVNVLLFAGPAILGSVGLGIFLLVSAIVIEVAVWNYKFVGRQLKSLFAHLESRREAKHLAAIQESIVHDVEVVPQYSENMTQPSAPARKSREVESDDMISAGVRIEIVSDSRPRRGERIPSRPKAKHRSREKQVKDIGDLPSSPRFLQANERLNVGFGEVVAPLVYASSSSQRGRYDASLIDGSLPVTSGVPSYTESLPYWPTYFDATPQQRKTYLDWLLGGRSDPEIELGYVFIYFYGLERRVIVEQRDLGAIADELIRLIPIYGDSNSFRGYATRLLWMAIYLSVEKEKLSGKRFQAAIDATSRWTDDLMELMLGTIYRKGASINSTIASLMAQNDHRSSNSVIVKRHNERFLQLFRTRYKNEFPKGLKLKASKRDSAISYHPASSSLHRDPAWESRLPKLPGVLRITSQFKPFVENWDACIEELKTYNRLHRKSDGAMTAEVYESLPPELRDDDHPEYDQWMKLWERYASSEGRPMVPVHELATLKSIEQRGKLTKGQSQRIVRTAAAIGLGVEPDVDVSGKNYSWSEPVCLFFEDPEAKRNIKAYKSATILLRLGMNIAGADGEFDRSELEFIDQHLESTFNLSDADSSRLECLTHLLAKSPDSNFSITKSLCLKLQKSARALVGEFLVGIAAADGVLHPAELKELKKAYRSLELEPSVLDQLLSRFKSKDEPAQSGTKEPEKQEGVEFKLDMNAISDIMTETRQVSRLLEEAMDFSDADDQGPEPSGRNEQVSEQADESTPNGNSRVDAAEIIEAPHFHGLAERYHGFLSAVLQKASWERDEIEIVARHEGQMLTGAVEAINEWSYEQFEDWLIEEGDEYQIHSAILESK